MSPKSKARRFSNSSGRLSKGKAFRRPNRGRGGYLYPSHPFDFKESVRKGALFRRPRGKSVSFKIDPKGFDRTHDDDGDLQREPFYIELFAQRALHTYNVYHNEKYKFVSLEKAVRKRGEPWYYYITFTIASKNDDVVKTVQAIIESRIYKSACVLYVKIIPSTQTSSTPST